MRAIHRLMGTSTFDPELRAAYDRGEIRELLASFGVEEVLIDKVASIPTRSFAEFLRVIHDLASARYEQNSPSIAPWPSHGLPGLQRGQTEKAA